MKELVVDVFGRVQGVGFRQFVKKSADELGVRGSVRNMPDGRVSITAQGTQSVLRRFLDSLQKGSFLSKVSGLSYSWKEARVLFRDFVISIDTGFIRDQKSSFTNLGKHLLRLQRTVPRHLAVIPDGNRRWARAQGLEASSGHKEASQYEKLMALLTAAQDAGVQYLTFWAFSTENWSRNRYEVRVLLSLIKGLLRKFLVTFRERQIRFRHLGRRDRLPASIVNEIEKLEAATASFDRFNVQLALDYGGRDELTRAVNRMLKTGVREVNEEDVSRYLDTEGIPDPDLIIRTSGEQRMSGFMPFQGAYAEYYFTTLHFPDFGPTELEKAIDEFSARKRNFGK